MQKRAVLIILVLCFTLSLAADQSAVFYFSGKRLFVGMSKSDAVSALSACCELNPPAGTENAALSRDSGRLIGHFIVSRDNTSPRILGSVYFSGGKVVRVTRPLDGDFDPESDDVVAFARAINRGLSSGNDNTEAVVHVSTRHSRATNGGSEIISLSFPNGRGVELQIVTLDSPSKTGKRDSVGLDEILELPKP
jgi:hypothetical protein